MVTPEKRMKNSGRKDAQIMILKCRCLKHTDGDIYQRFEKPAYIHGKHSDLQEIYSKQETINNQ